MRVYNFFVLMLLMLSSCSGVGDQRAFYCFFNEEYRMTECADMGPELPNAHAYFNQFNKDKVNYTQYFDIKKSVLELRVNIDDNMKPHGYGYIKLYKLNGEELINLSISNYLAPRIDDQWSSFIYNDFDANEPIYVFGKFATRFRFKVYIDELDKEALITFGYNLSKTYEYPPEFQDLSWMVK